MNLTKQQLADIANSIGIEYAALRAFIAVESGGAGFINGRIVIQFEPVWFRRKVPFAPSGAWSINKVENQTAEYKAFSEAFRINAKGAMEATSWGLGQIMGFHYARLGYKTVDDMVNDFKTGDLAQVKGIARFVATDPALLRAIQAKDWHRVAVNYNGANYKQLAAKYNREPYNISMQKAYIKYSNQ